MTTVITVNHNRLLSDLFSSDIYHSIYFYYWLTTFPVSLGETGLGLTIVDYDDVGQYTILAYDLPISLAGLSIGLAWNDIDYDDDAAEDDDVFAITFSM